MYSDLPPIPPTESGVIVSQPQHQSQFDGRPRARTIAPQKRRSRLRWVAALVMLIAAAAGLTFAFSERAATESKLKEAEKAHGLALERVASAERETSSAMTKLASAQKKLAISEVNRDAAEQIVKEKQEVANELERKMKTLLGEGEGEVLKGADGRLTLQLVDKILFKSGKAELTKSGLRVMSRVGKALATMDDKQVWVQGHTDNVPLKKNNEEFSSNWELSSARALSVVHFLQDESMVDPARLAAAAFSSYRPVSRRRKAKNRRIEIVLFPREVKLQR